MKTGTHNKNATSYSYEHIYKMALDNYPGSVIIIDAEGRILYCNDGSERMLGVSKEWLSSTDMQTVLKTGRVKQSGGLEALATRRETLKYIPNYKGDGMLISSRPILDDKRNVCLAVTYSQEETYLNAYLSWMKAEKDRVVSAFNYISTNEHLYTSLVAHSKGMRLVVDTALQVAPSMGAIALRGESGVGKEVIALFIHKHSKRANSIFLPVNCAAIPPALVESEFFGYQHGAFTGALKGGKPGLFEIADSGTILLDEIGELPLSLQAKLLRVLENGEVRRIGANKAIHVDVRVICATNRNLEELVKSGEFREDLYYRLNVLPIHIPPLRERLEDIPHLALAFLAEFNRKNGQSRTFSPEALAALENYSWPGNVRELRNAVERMVIISPADVIGTDLIPVDARNRETGDAGENYASMGVALAQPLKKALGMFERRYIENSFKACDCSVDETAKMLDITRSGLYGKMKLYGLSTKKSKNP